MAKLDLLVHLLILGACAVNLEGYALSKNSMKSSSDMVTHFASSGVLSSTNTMRIKVDQPTVTQIRVDFKTFTLAQPVQAKPPLAAYTCEKDKFRAVSATGADLLGFQNLCGENSGQHIYLYVDASEKPTYVDLIFEIGDPVAGNPAPTWNLDVTQIDCSAKPTKNLCAPPGCLQFYTEPVGKFQSFNYNDGKGKYQGSLNYAICFKNIENMCKITYTASKFQLPSDNFLEAHGQLGCNAETTDPSDPLSSDYIFIPNAVVEKVKDSLFCGNYLETKKAISTAPGPKSVFFHSDKVANYVSNGDEIGFMIDYQQSTGDCNA
ncbi:hypothetical protein J437_LFUL001750 [Ladona fulva]|uniref:CUB domain-containing protein n=1 Tax=Ladona fulva TaxID=123851 RepID=A0A8K0JWG1_LADFU|nr:hypothetical protein J437_LFUL001750 [Ladona fulva]